MITLKSGLSITNENFSIVLSHQRPARVILAVPHDGLFEDNFTGIFQPRMSGRKIHDLNVSIIANNIVQRSLSLGVRVDMLRLLMSRAYIDANRELPDDLDPATHTLDQTALDDPLLIPVHHYYYSELHRLVERSIQMFGIEQILFIDMHGFGHQPKFAPPKGYDIILGTANRSNIQHGEVDRTFAEFMEERGYRVFLPGEKSITPEGDPFSGRYTTEWCAKKYGINAMQIEIFSTFRMMPQNRERGEKLAVDVAEFLSENYR
ncbi:hypothetical protein EXS57_03900 [Candidatus Kaiserbacteria bacterium]|nr:hypothetical protein [Candidatus Kaiserbacteria bacterium]